MSLANIIMSGTGRQQDSLASQTYFCVLRVYVRRTRAHGTLFAAKNKSTRWRYTDNVSLSGQNSLMHPNTAMGRILVANVAFVSHSIYKDIQ